LSWLSQRVTRVLFFCLFVDENKEWLSCTDCC
jgi:hypothetical protein